MTRFLYIYMMNINSCLRGRTYWGFPARHGGNEWSIFVSRSMGRVLITICEELDCIDPWVLLFFFFLSFSANAERYVGRRIRKTQDGIVCPPSRETETAKPSSRALLVRNHNRAIFLRPWRRWSWGANADHAPTTIGVFRFICLSRVAIST